MYLGTKKNKKILKILRVFLFDDAKLLQEHMIIFFGSG